MKKNILNSIYVGLKITKQQTFTTPCQGLLDGTESVMRGPTVQEGEGNGHKTNTYNVVKIPPSKKEGSYTSFRISKYMFSLFQDLKCRVWRPPLVWHFTLEVRVVTDLVEDLKSISLFCSFFTLFQDLKFRVWRPLLVWGFLFQCRG